MRHFAITTPVMGLRKDWPSVLLDKSFMPAMQNVQFWNGETRTAKMRRRHFVRQSFECTVASPVVTVSGDVTSKFPETAFDLVMYNDAGSQVFNSDTAQVTCTYDAGTGLTTFTSEDAANHPLSFAATHIALVTAGMETDPTELAFLQVPVPDGNPIIRYHDHLGDEGDIYFFAFTKDNVYLWSTTLTDWLCAFEATECTYWSSASFNGFLIITNDVDAPQAWNGAVEASSFETLATVTGNENGSDITIAKAKFVTTFEGHVLFANYVLSNSSDYSNGIICSALDDHEDWDQSGVSDASAFYVEGEGVIDGGFGAKGDYLYVFKDRSARVFWYTGTDSVFNSRPFAIKVGTISPDSIINDADGNLYFYGSDMAFREVDLGIISNALGDDSRNIVQTPDLLSKIRSAYIAEYAEVWWSVPFGSQATGNNTTFCYKKGVWYQRDLAASAFGKYRENANYTWDTLPFSSWDEWDWASWDSVSGVSGWPLDVCADANGYSYLSHAAYMDAGTAYTSYFVLTTDLGDLTMLRWYKRMLAMQLFIQKEGDEAIDVYVKRDNEPLWQLAGSISVTTQENEVLTERLPVDYRAKRFEIKISSQKPFRFLGLEFDYELSGTR